MKPLLFTKILLGTLLSFLFTSCAEQECKLPSTAVTRQLKEHPVYLYPYTDLSQELQKKNITSLSLFVYGSLMSITSRTKTLPSNDPSKDKLALAFGVQRLFNLDVAYKEGSPYGPLKSENSRGMLNVRLNSIPDTFINGVIIDIPLSDLPALSKREECYNLVPVITADWKEFLHGRFVFSLAYILIAPEKPGITSDQIMPRNGYFELTESAAKSYGSCFEEFWLNTTYLSDGTTPISEWLKKDL